MAANPLPEWHDDGSLPLDGEGQLPFYLLDAHEELAQPGVVYLFGKVGRPVLLVGLNVLPQCTAGMYCNACWAAVGAATLQPPTVAIVAVSRVSAAIKGNA